MKIPAAILAGLALTFAAACGRAPVEPETVLLSVEGMTCENCVAGILQSLSTMDGFKEGNVDLESGRASVTYNPDSLTAGEIHSRINLLGFPSTILGNTPATEGADADLTQ